MNFKIATLFEAKLPPFTFRDTEEILDFDNMDVSEYLSETIKHLIETQGLIDLVEGSEDWEELFRDMGHPGNDHYTVSDGFELVDWEFKVPTATTVIASYEGDPKDATFPNSIVIEQGYDLADGGFAIFSMELPVKETAFSKGTDKLVSFTLGEPVNQKVLKAELPEPFDEPDYDYDLDYDYDYNHR